jgi:putative inorganic carbon (HCO3(-)) transporter
MADYKEHWTVLWLFKGYCCLALLLPWSFDTSVLGPSMQIPTEPLMAVLGLGLFYHFWLVRRHLKVIFQGKTLYACLISGAWIAWMALCIPGSSMPMVSLKYWVVESGQWWVFAIGLLVFPSWWSRLWPFWIISLSALCVYTLVHHSQYHFRWDQAILAPMPFFPDHTMFAAALTMSFPFVWFGPKKYWPAGILLLLGLLSSGCRAAFLALFIAAWAWVAMEYLKGKWRIAYILLSVCFGLVLFQTFALQELIKKDVSSMERLNRYDCAQRMVAQRPWMGFGPGVYQFQYIPFQQAEKMTRISLNAPQMERNPGTYGRGGGAHSEYWQRASETGWIGLFFWLLMTLGGWLLGVRAYLRTPSPMVAGALFCMLIFLMHSFWNNHLHDGRIAWLFWAAFTQFGNQSSNSSGL